VVVRLYRRWRWSVFLSILIGYAFFYTTRLSFSVTKKPVLDAGLLDAEQMGKIGFVLLLGYAAGKFVNGFWADHVNPSRFMATGLLVSAATNLVYGASTSYPLLLVLWGLNGWLQSMGAPACGVTMAAWFSDRERGTRYAAWSTSHNLGEAMTFAFTALLVSAAGWRWGFWGPGLLCTAVALVLYRTLADRPYTLGLPPIEEHQRLLARARGEAPAPRARAVDDEDAAPVSLRALQLEVLKNPYVWLLALASALMYVPRYAINHWGVVYLQIEKSYSLVEAGVVVSLFPLVGIVGTLCSGWISDRFFAARRAPLTLAYGLLFVGALAALFYGPPGHPWLVRAAMGTGGFAIGGLLVFLGGLAAMDISSRRAAGAALGLVGGMSYLGAAIQDWVSGSVIESTRRVVEGVVVYDFGLVKHLWVGAAVLSMVIALSLWRAERRGK